MDLNGQDKYNYFEQTSVKTGINIPLLFTPKIGGFGEILYQNYNLRDQKETYKTQFGFKFSIKTAKNTDEKLYSILLNTSHIDYTKMIKSKDSIAIVQNRVVTDIVQPTILGRISTTFQYAYNIISKTESKQGQIGIGLPLSLWWYSAYKQYSNILLIKSDTSIIPKYSNVALNRLDSSKMNSFNSLIGVEGFFRFYNEDIGFEGKIALNRIFFNKRSLNRITQSNNGYILSIDQDLLFKKFDFGIDYWFNVQLDNPNPTWGIFFYKRLAINDLLH